MTYKPRGVGAAKRGYDKKKKAVTDFIKAKAEAKLKDKEPKTPGELIREFKGKMTRGLTRSKKMLAGEYDLGKKLRKQRKHHS